MNTEKRLPLKAVVFDMDGLMIDSECYVKRSWDKAGEELGYGPLGHHMADTLGMNRKRRESYFLSCYGKDFPFSLFLETYRKYYYKETALSGVPLKPGLKELLNYLNENHYLAAVASSSGPEHVNGNLKRHQLQSCFQAVITGNMITHSKPEPDIYLEACRQLQVPPAQALALEDAPNGIIAASRAGLYPVMVPDLAQPTDALKPLLFRVCQSLAEIPKLLETCFYPV
ncbi:MAG: HAD family phosphatase [Lachnospiraceae bacterium]|nr:HAD family phosphatase [Lachnospiraceae bacterium]